MNEKVRIMQEVEKLAGKIEQIESGIEAVESLGVEFVNGIQIHYSIPIDYKYPYGDARTVSKEEKILFTVPDELREKAVDCIKKICKESLEKYYQLLNENMDKLKDTP